jgi:hypothetical protein
VDFCEHCGAKDWIPPPKVSSRTFWQEQKKELQDHLHWMGGCVGTMIVMAFWVGALWLFIAVVKWMWQHS